MQDEVANDTIPIPVSSLTGETYEGFRPCSDDGFSFAEPGHGMMRSPTHGSERVLESLLVTITPARDGEAIKTSTCSTPWSSQVKSENTQQHLGGRRRRRHQ